MCKSCADKIPKPTRGRFKIPKEELALLPGKCYSGPIKNLTPEQQEEHRLNRRAYERLYRKHDLLNGGELSEYQKKYHAVQQQSHPEKMKIQAREQYLKNPERVYQGERKRRALQNSVRTEPYTADDVLARWGTDCHLCGGPVDLEAPRSLKNYHPLALHLDHVVPISIGGMDIIENVKPAHAKCNLSRSKTNPLVGLSTENLDELFTKDNDGKPLVIRTVKRGRKLKD